MCLMLKKVDRISLVYLLHLELRLIFVQVENVLLDIEWRKDVNVLVSRREPIRCILYILSAVEYPETY